MLSRQARDDNTRHVMREFTSEAPRASHARKPEHHARTRCEKLSATFEIGSSEPPSDER